MTVSRRTLLAAGAAGALATPLRARAQGGPAGGPAAAPTIRLGVLNDQSGPYRDDTGPTSVACVRQAVQDFGSRGFNVEVVSADHQNKPDIGAAIVREWFDRGGVDAVCDVPTSSVALAVNTICREKNKVMLNSGAASTDLTGAQCSPNTVHWTYDTYMLARSTGGAMVRQGGDSWYFLTANYVFGQQLQRDTTRFVEQANGRVAGSAQYPFPETTDFSAMLLRAKASGAKVLGLCNSGDDTLNCIKQAREFGLLRSMKVAALLCYNSNIRSMGLDVAQGLLLTESYYWDLNDRTRAFNERIRSKTPDHWPQMTQAGNYGAALHYLKAVADLGPAAAKASGRAVVERMKAMPTDDDCFGQGRIRADGRKIHPSYLFEAKKPSESRGPWDCLKLVATTPAEEAFRPESEGGCPLVR
ncbi:ABC transporter substrate-binding protein [Roseomonas sp. NAR14]|uniref:ABC transporter substrate-binding protein n=1 Tax=Roseomonas acroporae TaxID=2937791 RepID=A0A9X1Y9M8_9PROT|nr:ABC transporter substrate-binding protein [Roseomonas acroporae]MCK8784925.1 ABC transporter substrate-binding protein [Roseomonas acroporae]